MVRVGRVMVSVVNGESWEGDGGLVNGESWEGDGEVY